MHVAALAAAVGCVSLCLYVPCLCPTVYWSDSGELIASSVEPGIAHPNGSPVYTLLGYACSRLPWRSVAWRVNLLSALSAALTVSLAFLAAVATARRHDGQRHGTLEVRPETHFGVSGARRVGLESPIPPCGTAVNGFPAGPPAVCIALAAAGALAVAPGLWEKATVANKYPTAAAACAGMLLLAVCRRPRPFWMGLLLGIGYGVHAIIACCAPLAALPSLCVGPGRRLRAIGLTLAGIVTGLLPFAYLPVRSLSDPVCDWGDPETPAGFWWLVSGQEFRGLILGASRQDLSANLAYVSGLTADHLGLPVVLCALAALILCAVRLARRSPAAIPLLAGLWVVLADVFLVASYDMTNDRYTWEAYLLPSYVALVVLAAAALNSLSQAARRSRRAAAWIAVVAIALTAGWGARRNFAVCDKSGVTAAREFGLLLSEQVAKDGVLVHNASQVGFLLDYLEQVEHTPGLGARVFLPLLSYPWYADQLRRGHPELDVPPASDRAGQDFVRRNVGRKLQAYPGALGRYVPQEWLVPDGWLLAVGRRAGTALRPVPEVSEVAGAIHRGGDDAGTVVTYLGVAHELAVYYHARGSAPEAAAWLDAAIGAGTRCGAADSGAVRQMVSLCRLTLGTALSGQGRWSEAERQLAAAGDLWTSRLRAEREIRWALALARLGEGTRAVSHVRRALRQDPSNAMARQLSEALLARP